MSRPLIIGQAPGRGPSRTSAILAGRAGARLAQLGGLSLAAYLRRFERRNLLDAYPGKLGKGDAFDPDAARISAFAMVPLLRRRRTVLLGWNVARAFQMDHLDLFEWADEIGDGALVAISPHPSGVSRWWNDPANVAAARAFWTDLAHSTKRIP